MVTKSKKTSAKKGKVKVGKLKLNKETVKDLTGKEQKRVKGGIELRTIVLCTLKTCAPCVSEDCRKL